MIGLGASHRAAKNLYEGTCAKYTCRHIVFLTPPGWVAVKRNDHEER